jgi:hypothetical protein
MALPAPGLPAQSLDSQAVQEQLLPWIREQFYVAVDDEGVTRELIDYIENNFSTDLSRYPPTVMGYYAALEGLKGRHDTNLLRKYRYVKSAIDMMEPLVAAHPDLLEVRFLRFSFYEQIPAVFGVHHHVREDLERIIEMLRNGRSNEVPVDVQIDMIDYILATDEPNPGQRRLLDGLKMRSH